MLEKIKKYTKNDYYFYQNHTKQTSNNQQATSNKLQATSYKLQVTTNYTSQWLLFLLAPTPPDLSLSSLMRISLSKIPGTFLML